MGMLPEESRFSSPSQLERGDSAGYKGR